MRRGIVYIHGKRAGLLTETDAGEYIFEYDTEYASVADNPPASLTLPLSDKPYRSDHLFSFFFNMLSEGENRQIQSTLLGIDAQDDFGILMATAYNDTIGAVTVKSE